MLKPFKTYEEQLQILENRGLIIFDQTFALKVLKQENYYNLINGYKELFLLTPNLEGTSEKFKKGTTFEEIYMLYSFDRELRNLLLNSFLKFETTAKARLAYRFSEKYREGHAYLEIKNYSQHPKYLKNISDLISNLFLVIKNRGNHSGAIKHYLEDYDNVPLWVLVNFMTFGNIQKMYEYLDPSLKNAIAKDFAEDFNADYKKNIIISSGMVESILKSINFFRNVCAHEERLYNYKIRKISKISSVSNVLGVDTTQLEKGNLFTAIVFLKLVTSKEEYEHLKKMIQNLFSKYDSHFKSLEFSEILMKMGFQPAWEETL